MAVFGARSWLVYSHAWVCFTKIFTVRLPVFHKAAFCVCVLTISFEFIDSFCISYDFSFRQKPSCCILTYLYNVLYTVCTQKYIITLIKYIQSGHITAACFDRKRPSSGQLSATLLYLKNILYWPEDDRLRSKHVAVM